MQMSSESKKLLVKSSSLAPSVLGGDRDVYVIVKEPEGKEAKEVEVKQTVISSSGNGPSSYLATNNIKTILTYDFVITPSTTQALATYQAISAFSDSAMTSYWAHLYSNYRVDEAQVELDFHEYQNMTGVADKFSALMWSYRSNTSASVPGYTSISDDASSRPIKWSAAKPNVVFKVTPSMLKDGGFVDNKQQAVAKSNVLGKWAPLEATYEMCRGYVHIASYDTFNVGTSGRRIFGRLKLWVTLSNKL